MELRINGVNYTVAVASDTVLLDVLRSPTVGIISVREGCGVGACGSCTVLIDGRSVSSCLVLAGRCEGRDIRTSEGLDPDDAVVSAFVASNALQCGYCIPGFLLMSKELLSEDPNPDRTAIMEHLEGNICRCGTYPDIVNAVMAAAGGTPEEERTRD